MVETRAPRRPLLWAFLGFVLLSCGLFVAWTGLRAATYASFGAGMNDAFANETFGVGAKTFPEHRDEVRRHSAELTRNASRYKSAGLGGGTIFALASAMAFRQAARSRARDG